MKVLKQLICLAISAIMIAMSVACANGSKQDGKETEAKTETNTEAVSNNTEETTGESVTQDMSYTAEIGEVDFGGKTVSVLVYDKIGVKDEFYAEKGDTGEPVNDAVYTRNQALVEALNIDLQYHLFVNVGDEASLEASTQAGTYHIVTNMTNVNIGNVFKGNVYDLSLIDTLDFDKGYWSQGFRDIASFGTGDSQYLITGAPAITLYKYMYTTIFNKEVFEARDWESLYDVVNRGEWTLDYQARLVSDSWADTDSVSGPSDGDFYGLVTGDTVSVDPYLTACGLHIVKKDSDGKWYWDSTIKESVVKMIESIRSLYYDVNGTFVFKSASYDDTGLTYIIDKFADSEAAMATIMFIGLETGIGKISFDFGIAPMPKYSADPNVPYRSYVQDQVTSIGVLKSVSEDDFDRMGSYLELLAQYSYEKVIPEYYQRTLSKKFMTDAASRKMLDLISDSVEFDFVGAFSGCLPVAVRDQLRLVVSGTGTNISSSFASWERSISKKIDKFVNEKLQKLQK